LGLKVFKIWETLDEKVVFIVQPKANNPKNPAHVKSINKTGREQD